MDISKNILDVTKEYDSPRYSLKINGVHCAPVGGLHIITGQSGHGKTNLETQLMAAYLGDTSHAMEYSLEGIKPKLLFCDTEMEPENTMMVNLRVCAMTGREYHTPYEDFTIMVLRGETTAEARWLKILKGIKDYMPTAVFIDGMIDIVADFNDNKQCQDIIFEMMALATFYDIDLWVVLHQNPGSEKMVGHAGSFLERKATDVFRVKKDKTAGYAKFIIEQIKARGKDVPEVQFIIDDMGGQYPFGMPQVINAPTPEQAEAEKSIDLAQLVREVITTKEGITTRDLREALKAKLKLGSKKTDELMWKLEDEKYVFRNENKRYFLNTEVIENPNFPF